MGFHVTVSWFKNTGANVMHRAETVKIEANMTTNNCINLFHPLFILFYFTFWSDHPLFIEVQKMKDLKNLHSNGFGVLRLNKNKKQHMQYIFSNNDRHLNMLNLKIRSN